MESGGLSFSSGLWVWKKGLGDSYSRAGVQGRSPLEGVSGCLFDGSGGHVPTDEGVGVWRSSPLALGQLPVDIHGHLQVGFAEAAEEVFSNNEPPKLSWWLRW